MTITKVLGFAVGSLLLFFMGVLAAQNLPLGRLLGNNTQQSDSLLSPFTTPPSTPTPTPLNAYALDKLSQIPREANPIKPLEVLAEEPEFTSYVFEWSTLGKKMTGQLNLPQETNPTTPVIILLRGYVSPEIYSTGVGTKNAAAAFAKAGYITVAPDFFGYGESEPEPEDTWQARFEKPLIVLELIDSLSAEGIFISDQATNQTKIHKTSSIGIWAHSNGGQIALATLLASEKEVPTTLWAPVTAPFPYSILYFGDELEDEGKDQRKWIALFEENYDVFNFSISKHLNLLQGPLQFHHGTNDDAALHFWSIEFLDKVKAENIRRQKELKAAATLSAERAPNSSTRQKAIEYELFLYPGANHNLQPGWDTAIARDLAFFGRTLVPQESAIIQD